MRKMNVLIVDDEEPVLMLLERILAQETQKGAPPC
jgi:PleD family two-component response regulator